MKLLTPGEIAVGQYVTVLNWLDGKIVSTPSNQESDNTFEDCMTAHTLAPLAGTTMLVKAVDLPFVVCLNLSDPRKGFVVVIDTRLLQMAEPKLDFVRSTISPEVSVLANGIEEAVHQGMIGAAKLQAWVNPKV